jgi:hypothetical protein
MNIAWMDESMRRRVTLMTGLLVCLVLVALVTLFVICYFLPSPCLLHFPAQNEEKEMDLYKRRGDLSNFNLSISQQKRPKHGFIRVNQQGTSGTDVLISYRFFARFSKLNGRRKNS